MISSETKQQQKKHKHKEGTSNRAKTFQHSVNFLQPPLFCAKFFTSFSNVCVLTLKERERERKKVYSREGSSKMGAVCRKKVTRHFGIDSDRLIETLWRMLFVFLFCLKFFDFLLRFGCFSVFRAVYFLLSVLSFCE